MSRDNWKLYDKVHIVLGEANDGNQYGKILTTIHKDVIRRAESLMGNEFIRTVTLNNSGFKLYLRPVELDYTTILNGDVNIDDEYAEYYKPKHRDEYRVYIEHEEVGCFLSNIKLDNIARLAYETDLEENVETSANFAIARLDNELTMIDIESDEYAEAQESVQYMNKFNRHKTKKLELGHGYEDVDSLDIYIGDTYTIAYADRQTNSYVLSLYKDGVHKITNTFPKYANKKLEIPSNFYKDIVDNNIKTFNEWFRLIESKVQQELDKIYTGNLIDFNDSLDNILAYKSPYTKSSYFRSWANDMGLRLDNGLILDSGEKFQEQLSEHLTYLKIQIIKLLERIDGQTINLNGLLGLLQWAYPITKDSITEIDRKMIKLIIDKNNKPISMTDEFRDFFGIVE